MKNFLVCCTNSQFQLKEKILGSLIQSNLKLALALRIYVKNYVSLFFSTDFADFHDNTFTWSVYTHMWFLVIRVQCARLTLWADKAAVRGLILKMIWKIYYWVLTLDYWIFSFWSLRKPFAGQAFLAHFTVFMFYLKILDIKWAA